MKNLRGAVRLGATFLLHLLTRPWRPRASPALPPPRSVLAIELARMGDAIAATAALRALRRAFPAVEITYAVEEPWAGLFGPPVADRVIAGRGTRSLGGFLGLVREIRGRRYDLVVNLSPSARNTAALLLARARRRAGYLDLRSSLTPFRLRSAVFTFGLAPRAAAKFGPRMGIPRRAIQVLLALGVAPDGLEPEIRVPAEAESPGGRAAGETPGPPLVCLHPGAGWGGRRWPAERWASLVRHVIATRSLACALIGSAGEKPLLDEIAAASGDAPAVLCGLPIPHLAARIARSAAFVGSDSGPLHLAAALGVPALGLFGPAPPRETAPAARGPLVNLHIPRECCPCDQTGCVEPARPCLAEIGLEEVVSALDGLLGEVTARPGGARRNPI